MKLKKFILLGLVLLLSCPPVFAADEPEGYIIHLTPEAVLSADADAKPIYEPEGLYCTDDLSLVRDLEDQGMLESWEEDRTVFLFGYEEDLAFLKSETWSRAMLGSNYADSCGVTGQGVRVGVIDSGVAMIPALTDRMIKVWNDPEDPEQGYTWLGHNYVGGNSNLKDTLGHGTFVSSVIASAEVGLAPGIKLVPLKCFSGNRGQMSDVIKAIYGGVDDYGCRVLNMSFGDTSPSEELQTAVEYALDKGVILVAACGNLDYGKKSTGDDPPLYPAACDGVISVGSLGSDKQVAAHSRQNGSVWVTAPGLAVQGLSLAGTVISRDGTSYAAPAVTAAAALALSADPDLAPEDFQDLLADTAEDLGEPGRDNAYGWGLMNLGLLLAEAREDSESVIPSYYSDAEKEDTLCLSSYQPPAENAVTWLARYEDGGRFFSLETLAASLNNRPLTEEAPLVKLMTVDAEGFTPIRPAAAYGFAAADPSPPEEPEGPEASAEPAA